jgi:TPR repeat protein
MFMRVRVVTVLLALMFAQCVFAGPDEDSKAKKKDKFEITLNKLIPLATKGDAEAQLQLGESYYIASNELSELKYCNDAFDWVRKSAEQGYGHAMARLGDMYQYEEVDCPKGKKLSIYWNGKAVSYFTRLAKQGQVDAMTYLAQMYWHEGSGMNDRAKAIYWFSKAANLGNASAQTSLAGIYNAEGLNDVPKEALVKAALQGNASAEYELALKYANGSGIAKDYVQAAHLFKQAADQGHSWASYFLGVMYANGDGVEKDDVQAAHWLQKSVGSEHPHPNAKKELAKLAKK